MRKLQLLVKYQDDSEMVETLVEALISLVADTVGCPRGLGVVFCELMGLLV